MKRKRAARKKAVSEKPSPSVNADEHAFINFVAQSVNENSLAEENNHTEKVQFNTGTNLKSSSSSSDSSDNEESFHLDLDGRGDEVATFSRKSRSISKQGHQKKGKASMQTSNASVLPPRGSVSNIMSSRGSGSKVMPPFKGLNSSIRKELPSVKDLSQDPRYSKLELKASLAVIKKVMELEEAGPFNTPVDPVAQGLPDYFNVVDTPMDFGTIYSNLQNGVKYLNSDDVCKDVNYIWENCINYNKKGDYIVYLMKRVKKKFMKNWKLAGLRSEILEKHNGPHSMPSSDHDMWQSRHEALSAVNRMVTNSNRMQQKKFDTSQPQPSTSQVPPFSQLHGVGSSYTDVTRGRAHDVGGGHRLGRDSSGKTTPRASVPLGASMFDGADPSLPSFPTFSSSKTTRGIHTPQASARSPLLPAIFKRIQQLVPPDLSPECEPEPEPEQEQELESEPELEVSEDEVGDSTPGSRTTITVIGDAILPSEMCSRTIRKIFQKKLDINGAKWKTVPQETKEYYFQEFKKHYCWDKSIDHEVRCAWNKKAAKRYGEFMSAIRNKGVKPSYVSDVVWKKWLEVWSDPAYKRMSQQNKLNRRKGDENGVALACHTGGSIMHLVHRKRLAEQLGRDPTPHELFVYTHTKQHDGKTFVHEKAKEVNERVESIKEQMTHNSSTVDESQVFFEAAGGKVKNRVYGLGSEGKDYYQYKKTKSAELQLKLEQLEKQQQSTEQRHEERYNVLLETIKKQTEIISAMQQKIESTAPIAPANVCPIRTVKNNPRGRAKRRARY